VIENGGIAVISALPERVGEKCGTGRIREHVAGKEVAAEDGRDAERGQKIAMRVVTDEADWAALGEIAGLRHGTLRGDGSEGRLIVLPVVKEATHHELVGLDSVLQADGNETVGLSVGKRAEEDAIGHAEYCRRRTDGEREGDDDSQREEWITAEAAEAVADIRVQLVKSAQTDGVAISFVLGCGLAEIDTCFAASFVRAEAVTDEVLLIGIEGEAEFFFDIIVAARREGLAKFA
jgi:hypothetical protein